MKKKTKKRAKKTALFICLAALLTAVGWLALDIRRALFLPAAGFQPRTVTIPQGASVERIGRILQREGLIKRSSYFYWYYRLFHRREVLKAGEYRFTRPPTMPEIIQRLGEGSVLLERLVIQEGLSVKEIARQIDASGLARYEDFRAAARSAALVRDLDAKATDLEGYLFPDTYMVRRGMAADEIVAMMVANFRSRFQQPQVWRSRDIGFSVRQTLTLASLIEKETAAPEERFMISSVFHNRLRRGMLLDCDPTIIYALDREDRYFGKLGWDDLKIDSPYNTRRHRGLPPGPICNPGAEAIRSALYPAESSFLYFVSKDGRSHHFSETLAEHNRAVRRFVINQRHGLPGR